MDKKMILVLLVIIASLSIPALAALEWTETLLYFNVETDAELTVFLYGETDGNVTAEAPGNDTLYNIEFNSTTGNDAWMNGTVTGGATSTQDFDNGIIIIQQTGTVTPTTLNISTNVSDWSTQGNPAGCIDLHYFANNTANAVYSAGTPASEAQLNTTNVTLDASFDPGDDDWEVWLWGNFSNCQAGTFVEMFYVWADFP